MVDQKVRDAFFNELVKKGYSKVDGKKVWSAANRSLLHMSPELSKGFLKLMDYGPYKRNVFDKEVSLIRESVKKFSKQIGNDSFNLIDIGCGNGEKAKEFINSLKSKANVRYVAVSPDKYLTDLAIKSIKEEKISRVKDYVAINTNYEDLNGISTEVRSNTYKKNIILLHGSILASYEINDYLFKLSSGMFKGDLIIIGNGIRTGERLVSLEKYKDKVFDNWFIPLMNSLGYKNSEVEYNARFGNSRVECFYTLKKTRIVRNKWKIVKFNKGDEIMVFYLYKYFYKELEKFFKMYFSKVEMVKDKENEYTLAFCAK